MSLNTTAFTLSSEWVQITDGTETKSIQVKSGVIEVVDSDVNPPDDAEGMLLTGLNTITPPTVAWCRAHPQRPVRLVVMTR